MINSDDFRLAFGEDDESLAVFLRAMSKFDRYFCEVMAAGVDFTLKMEVHGNAGQLLHARVHNDSFDRTHGGERKIEKVLRKKQQNRAD